MVLSQPVSLPLLREDGGFVSPYHVDPLVTLYLGDCIEVMRELPDASVDSVVTDPPYGLEFMGKAWDQFKATGNFPGGGKGTAFTFTDQQGSSGYKAGAPKTNPYSGAAVRYTAGHPYQFWCTEWATEAFRVLKPGGYILAFGGTRTYHRLASAIEDAGFSERP